jgi:hypothetical protein
MPVQVTAQIHSEKASFQFKEARREINRRMRDALKEAGEEVALPAARVGASRFSVGGTPVAGTLVVRSTSRGAYITTRLRGRLARAVGLLEYGGTVRTPLTPKDGGRGHFPVGGGEFRATVTGPRTYEPRLFMTGAVKTREGRIATSVRDRLLDAFRPEFDVD